MNSTIDICLDLHDLSASPIDTKILCLLKIGQKEHIESLSLGKLFCHHLAYYKRQEAQNESYYDQHEGLAHVQPAEEAHVVIKNEKTGESYALNLASGSQLTLSANVQSPVFCLHAIHTGEWTHREFSEHEVPVFRDFLQVPDCMNKFGDYVFLLKNPNLFFERVRTACNKMNIGFTGDLVRYANLKTCRGNIPTDRIGFIKQKAYESEREYRLMFRGTNLSDPFILDIGDLREISLVTPLKEFRDNWQIHFQEVVADAAT